MIRWPVICSVQVWKNSAANDATSFVPVAIEFFTDADSVKEIEAQAKSLFCPKTMESYTRDPEPLLRGLEGFFDGHL